MKLVEYSGTNGRLLSYTESIPNVFFHDLQTLVSLYASKKDKNAIRGFDLDTFMTLVKGYDHTPSFCMGDNAFEMTTHQVLKLNAMRVLQERR